MQQQQGQRQQRSDAAAAALLAVGSAAGSDRGGAAVAEAGEAAAASEGETGAAEAAAVAAMEAAEAAAAAGAEEEDWDEGEGDGEEEQEEQEEEEEEEEAQAGSSSGASSDGESSSAGGATGDAADVAAAMAAGGSGGAAAGGDGTSAQASAAAAEEVHPVISMPLSGLEEALRGCSTLACLQQAHMRVRPGVSSVSGGAVESASVKARGDAGGALQEREGERKRQRMQLRGAAPPDTLFFLPCSPSTPSNSIFRTFCCSVFPSVPLPASTGKPRYTVQPQRVLFKGGTHNRCIAPPPGLLAALAGLGHAAAAPAQRGCSVARAHAAASSLRCQLRVLSDCCLLLPSPLQPPHPAPDNHGSEI